MSELSLQCGGCLGIQSFRLLLMLPLCLYIQGSCTRIASLLQLNRESLNDVGEDPLALDLFKYLVFVHSRQSRVLRHCQPQLVEELRFLQVLGDRCLD